MTQIWSLTEYRKVTEYYKVDGLRKDKSSIQTRSFGATRTPGGVKNSDLLG